MVTTAGRSVATGVLSALTFVLVVADAAEASRFRPSFHVAWEKAPVIVIGMLGTPATMKEARIVSGGKTTWSRGPTAAYPLDTYKFFRGSKPRGKRMFVIDHHYRTTASVRVIEGASYLLFLDEEPLDERAREKLGTGDNPTYRCILELPWHVETAAEIMAAIGGLRAYLRLKSRDEKVRFLLSQLAKPNRHLAHLASGQICALKVREAIPHYEGLLSAESERTRLDAVWVLRAIGYERAGDILIGWLRDPAFKNKVDVLIELTKHMRRRAIPHVRQCAASGNERVRAQAGASLLNLGEADGKRMLFEILATAADRTARSNAMHALNWGYSGAFTDREKLVMERLRKDEDESIRRVAGFILERIAVRKKALPDIRKRAESDDVLTRARAGADLVRFGEADGKRLLFEILAAGAEGAARDTALRALHQCYRGALGEDERAVLKKLLADGDEPVRRWARLILDREGAETE